MITSFMPHACRAPFSMRFAPVKSATFSASLRTLALAGLAAFMVPSPSQAHVTLEKTSSLPGAGYKAIFRVGHGCEGSPTVSLKVQIPEGILAAKPMPKAGWTVEIVKGAYQKSYDYYGKPVAEGVREITFTGKLLDENYDEFVVNGYVAKETPAGAALYFPVTQSCETGAHRWTEIPAAGQESHALKEPAPFIRIAGPDQKAAAPALRAGALTLTHLWLREPPPAAKTAGGYLTIANTGSAPDRLMTVEASLAGSIEVHEMSNADGVMRMKALPDGLDLPAGQTVELKPGGYHVMFTGLKEPLKAGVSIPATLVFEKAGRVAVTFTVEGAAAQAGGHQHGEEEHKH